MEVMSTPRSSQAAAPSDPEQVFAGNSRFELKRVVGEGGMGIVYEAFDRERGMPVALKTVRALDAQALYRLKTEFRARVDLEHRNLVRLGELLATTATGSSRWSSSRAGRSSTWVRDGSTGRRARRPSTASGGCATALRQLAPGSGAPPRRQGPPRPQAVERAGDARGPRRAARLRARRRASRRTRSARLRRGRHRRVHGARAGARRRRSARRRTGTRVGVMLYEALTGRLPFDGRAARDPDAQAAARIRAAGVGAARRRSSSTLCCELLRRRPRRPARPRARRRRAARRSRTTTDERAAAVRRSRASELGQLDAALDEVAAGATATVFVEGESGIGKSALVRSFVERVDDRRARRARARGPLLRARVGAVQGHRRRRRRARARADAAPSRRRRAAPDRTTSRRSRACSRCCAACRRSRASACRARPRPSSCAPARSAACARCSHRSPPTQTIVIVIDDLQWADTDSIALLARDPRTRRTRRAMLVVITRRATRARAPSCRARSARSRSAGSRPRKAAS